MTTFANWIQTQLAALDDAPEFDEQAADDLRKTIREASRRASLAGIPDAVKACDIRAGGISPGIARETLAACLKAAPEPPVEPPDLLTVEAVATKLQASPSHVRRLADSGRMPRPLKLGGSLRFVRAKLEDWIQSGCKPVRRK